MTTETFTTAGQATWVCPAGVSTVNVGLWGGGGGGGGNAVASDGGGGGSGGGYGRVDAYAVVAGTTYTFNVGAQGVGLTSLAGTAGGVTWWRDAATYQVPGGTAGKVVAAGAPGGVGTAVPTSDASFVGTFTVKKPGGNGGAGVNNNSGGGGGGGGSSGDTTNAGNGGTGTAGAGGAGGAAGTTDGGIGGVGGGGTNHGIAPVSGNGGGGGGSGEGVVKGGDGSVGKVVLVYTVDQKLYLRNTQANGIGATYYDMLETAGSASDTGVVAATAAGTEIQLTKTSGGALVNFVTPPLSAGFTLTRSDLSIWAKEAALTVNAGGRARFFRRQSDGTETELGGGPFDDGIEFTTTDEEYLWSANYTDTAFVTGDRLLLKLYITNIGVMVAGDATFTFNAADAATGDAFITVSPTLTFSAEGGSGGLLWLSGFKTTHLISSSIMR